MKAKKLWAKLKLEKRMKEMDDEEFIHLYKEVVVLSDRFGLYSAEQTIVDEAYVRLLEKVEKRT
jgi:hypothetical protein